MSDLAQVLELLRGQNQVRVADREEDKEERDRMAKKIKDDIKAEIKEVMKPWQERTEVVEEKTKTMEDNITKLLTEVADLKNHLKKVDSTWAGVAGAGVGAGVGAILTGDNAAPLGRRTCMKEQEVEYEENNDDKENVLEKARRTLGFGPIRSEDINRQFKECGMFGMARDEEEAKAMAVMELLHLDMKVSKTELSEMETVRVFAPRRDNSMMLYCEFKRMSAVHIVYSHTRNMRKGTNITSYIPKEHYERYRALEEICYRWRKEEGYCRTKVRMGRKGLEIWRKRGEEMEYSQVPLYTLGDLPEVSLVRKEERQEERSMTTSPPPGRPGYTPTSARGKQGKRGRSKSGTMSPESRSPPSKKSGEGGKEKQEHKKKEQELVGSPTISPITNGLLKKPDLGAVTNVQLSTPLKKPAFTVDNFSSPIIRKSSTSA